MFPRSLRRAVWAAVLAVAMVAPRPAAALDHDWGIRTGWSKARLQGSFGEAVGGELLNNVAVALYAHLPLGSRLGFQPEIDYAPKGGQQDVEFTFTPIGSPPTTYALHVENRVPYLEVPLLLRIDARSGGSVKPYVLLGPAPAFRAGDARTNVTPNYSVGMAPARLGSPRARPAAQIFEDVGTLDSGLRTRSFDLGAVGGFGVWFGKGPARIGVEARYVRGLLDVHPGPDVKVRNEMFVVSTAVEFH